MLKQNEYFDGKVKSISFSTHKGAATVGVMEPGEYEFGTSTVEFMTVVSGSMKVRLPDEIEFSTYGPGETFIVDKNRKFQLQILNDCAYLCEYR